MGLKGQKRGQYKMKSLYRYSSTEREKMRALFTDKGLSLVGKACDRWLKSRGITDSTSRSFIVGGSDAD